MMNGDDQYLSERHGILSRLLDAVKQCQVRFGGRTELATDGDSRVSCLCAAWEAALQHGMRRNNKALSAFKQVTEMTGLSKVTGVFGDIKNLETEPTFWAYVKEHLTKHEAQRYTSLKSMVTDAGRGRAWLRASLNEHSLERYMHMLLEDTQLLSQYYEDWSFLRDQERSSMLPMMAAGLGSILFAITIDKTELNSIRQAPINIAPVATTSSSRAPQEPQPVISGEPIIEKKKEKKKKKKVATIVTFGEDDEGTYSSSPSSVKSPTVSVTDHSVSHHNFSFAQPDDGAGQDTATTSTAEPSPDKDVIQFDFSVDDSSKSEDKSDKVEEKPLVLENKLVLSVNRSDIEARAKNDSSVIGIEKDTARLTLDLETTVKEEGGIDISRSPRSSDHEPSLTSLSSVERPSSHGSFSSTADAEETDPQDVLTPVTPSGKVLNVQLSLTKEDTVSGSVDSGDLLSYAGEEVEFAAKALALAQKGFTSHGLRTEGDGGDSQDMSSTSHETMSTQELKQAVVAMMMRKDEVEEQNRLVRSMLEQEMETSSTLKAEIEELKVVNLTRQEKDMAKLHALQKENELLKHQLRKYVNAVQLLRKSEDPSEDPGVSEKLGIHLETPQPTIPPQKPHIDYSHEASEYEKKLIQVAEMHGELMEFNELLHRQLSASGRQVRQLTAELVDLRGPANHIFPPSSGHLNLPQDDITFADGEFESSQLQNRTLINIWIPSAFLRGSSTGAHHVYQVYVRIRDEEWNVYRRYNQFRDFLTFLKKKHPMVSKFDFPPKKAIGSKDAKVVEMRRRTLQVFLRNVINYMRQHDSDLSSNVSKDKLTELMPFFGDEAVTDPKSKKAKKQKPAAGGRRQSRQPAVQPQAMPAEAPPQYTGL